MSLAQISVLAQIVALLCSVLRTARGETWWHGAKPAGFIPPFISDVDAVLARNGEPFCQSESKPSLTPPLEMMV
jgi:hypothetical protein